MFLRALSFFCLLTGFIASPALGGELRTFLPHWLPQSQFAGYYMALEKGYYQNNGIALTIQRGGPENPAAEALTQRRADFATLFLSTAIQLRDRGVRLVNIGQIVQRSGFILVTKKASGIRTPADFEGKKVGLWPDFRLQADALFRKYGVKVRPVIQGDTLNLFLRGGVAAASAMWYNEYHNLLNAGLSEDELRPFFLDQHGLGFPEDGLYCLEETFHRNEALSRRFVQASWSGWEYAYTHPEETLDVVMRHAQSAHRATNRVHQKWMLEKIRGLIYGEGKGAPPGTLTPAAYQQVAGELKRRGIIRAIPPYGDFYVGTPPR